MVGRKMGQQARGRWIGLAAFCAALLVGLLNAPTSALAYDKNSPFGRCYEQYCQTQGAACYATLCPKTKYGCSVPCGIFSNRNGACPNLCSSVGSLFEKEACSQEYMDFGAACMGGCVSPDEAKTNSCARDCLDKARELRKKCRDLVVKERMTEKEAAKKVYPTRKKGASGNPASGERYILHNGKIFVINEAKWKRRVLRSLPHEMGPFYDPNEIDFLRMDWAADSAVILTGVGTAAAVTVGVMTGGTAIVIGAGVTFVASGFKAFVEKSSDTLDVKEAAVEGVKAGAIDAAVGTVFDTFSGGMAGGAKVALREAYKKTAKEVVKRKVSREIVRKTVDAVSKSKVGAKTLKLYKNALKTPLVHRLERKMILKPKSGGFKLKGSKDPLQAKRVMTSHWDNTVTVLTGQDAAQQGLEVGLTNRLSGELSNFSKARFVEYWDRKQRRAERKAGKSSSALIVPFDEEGGS